MSSKKADYDETLAAVHSTVECYPGLYRDVQTYLRERIKEVLTGSSEAVVVRIFGPDLATLRSKATGRRGRIADVHGVVDAHAASQTDLPHVAVEPDVARARQFRAEARRHPPAGVDPDR